MKDLKTYLVEKVQKGDSILIKGVTGTGKTNLAEELYRIKTIKHKKIQM